MRWPTLGAAPPDLRPTARLAVHPAARPTHPVVHLVARPDIPNFLEQKRAEGFGIDVKLMIFMNF